ncbi:phage tail protein [Citrobacter portucalensis]
MSAKFYTLLTDIGAAKLASAAALGIPLKITHMAVGDGGGALPTPSAQQTALVAEKRRAALNMLYIDPQNSSQIIAEQVIPETEGGWWIREVGLFDDTGALIAVGNCPESYKPQLAEGSGRTQTVRMVLITSSTDNITLKIDPAVVLATRKYVDDKVLELKVYVDELMAKHLAAADPHTQYAPKESPALTGTPKAPTAPAGTNTTQIANTAFVQAVVTALNNALALKAPLASPALTGVPTAPTAAQTVNNTQVATTAFVKSAIAALVASSPAALDTLNELAAALGNDPNFATTMTNALAGKQPLDSTLTTLSGKTADGIIEYLGLDVALSNKQPLSDTLTKLATLGPQTDADQVLFFSGKNVPAVTALTLAGRQLISKESVPDMLQYLTLGDGTGRLLGVQVFGNSGTYIKSPGVTKIIVEAVGGGGASGNLSATASNNCGISAAGSPGAYGKAFYYQNIPASVSVTVGGGGVGGAGPDGSGGDGGQTSFGSLLVCPGGKGSQQRQQVPPFSGGSAGEADQPTGAGLLFHSVSRSPSCASFGLGDATSVGLENTISTMIGVYGKGGTGKYNPANSAASRGNDGYQGYIIVWEYQ